MVAAASWLLACAGLVWFPNISAAGVPFGVPFGSGVPIGVPIGVPLICTPTEYSVN